LDWYWWIDLFYALVHNTPSDPATKFAVLKEKMKDSDGSNIVYGLGGGEDYYKEGLRRLKQKYGRRDVLRASHELELEQIEFRGLDSKEFYLAASRARTHLFELSRLGASLNVDLIERMLHKMERETRMEWNSSAKAPGDLDLRSLDDFGTWLCTHASLDRDAYTVAAEQLNLGSTSSPRGGRHVRFHPG